jgi:hypothetical protein
MSNNVVVLGAGFSSSAGIPLLGGFVERMWEFAARKTHNGEPLSHADLEIFEDAIKVKNELDSYHGRAVFNDRNIEDILSILSFNVLGGGRGDKNKLDKINRAIARTIELSCSVTHTGVKNKGSNRIIETGPAMYRDFWRHIFQWQKQTSDMPTIITFNYDLVLERALLQLLIGMNYDKYQNKLPFRSFEIKYFYERCPRLAYLVKYAKYLLTEFKEETGTILESLDSNHDAADLAIEILKLHGSLNFPKPRVKFDEESYNFIESLEDPQILPPISNKMSDNMSDDLWRIALQRLRRTKNVVIVGYSLPRTDIYMQYFLKAALGPNMDLNRISVFDPILYEDSVQGTDMCARYQECFASQLHDRINFRPGTGGIGSSARPGSAAQFVEMLGTSPQKILF